MSSRPPMSVALRWSSNRSDTSWSGVILKETSPVVELSEILVVRGLLSKLYVMTALMPSSLSVALTTVKTMLMG